MAESIADFVATISAAGVESFAKSVGIVGDSLKAIDKSVAALANANIAAFGKMADGMKAVGSAAASAGNYVKQSFKTADVTGYVAAWDAMKSGASSLTKGFSSLAGVVGGSLKSAFVGATATIFGLATAGLAGTVEANMLSFAFGQMARAIGGLFMPVIRSAIDLMYQVRDWIHRLTDAQRDSILKWAGLAGGIALFTTGIGKIPGIIMLVTQGFRLLSESSTSAKWLAIAVGVGAVITGIAPLPGVLLAGTAAMTLFGDNATEAFEKITSGIDKFIGALVEVRELIVAVAAAATVIAASTGNIMAAGGLAAITAGAYYGLEAEAERRKSGKPLFGGMGKDRGNSSDLTLMAGGFESPAETYRRIAMMTAGRDPIDIARQQKAEQEKTNAKLDNIKVAIDNALQVAKPPAPQLMGGKNS